MSSTARGLTRLASIAATSRRPTMLGPRDAQAVGSIAWCWQTVAALEHYWHRLELEYGDFERILSEIEGAHVWENIPSDRPYGSLEALLLAELGVTLGESRQRLSEVKLRKGPGRPPKEDNGNNITISPPRRGTAVSYTLARLKRDRPDLAERVDGGEMSANAAAIEAGFRKRTVTIPLTVQGLWRVVQKLSASERAELLALLNGVDS